MPRPIPIQALRSRLDSGQATPFDLQQISWLRTARRVRLPYTAADKVAYEIGAFIRAYRENNKLTQKEFGKRCGMSASRIAQIEVGIKTNFKIDTLLKLATACGMKMVFHMEKLSNA